MLDISEVGLCCPNCGGSLTSNAQCVGCGEKFNVVMGILDLRCPRVIAPDLREEKLVASLTNAYQEATFNELMALHFQNSGVAEKLLTHYQDYRANAMARSTSMLQMFETRLSEYYDVPQRNIALDIGCGVGTGVVVLSRKYKWVVGVDIFLSKLILARKFLEEHHIDNFILVQAYAQNLPLVNDAVDYIIAQNVIEHLLDVKTAFYEIRRVLKTDGVFCGDSRNRFDLFLPEPHVQLRWVGFWPRKLQSWYVKKLRGAEYESTRLLSLVELYRLARHVFGKKIKVVFPYASAYGYSLHWDKFIKKIEVIPLLGNLLLLIFPSHVLLVKM